MRIVFFGTPEFSAQVLDSLLESSIDVVAVVSKPDRPKGRSGHPVPTPVKNLIHSKYSHIPLYQPEVVSGSEFSPILEACQADLFVVVAYGEILKQAVLDIPRLACINVHASLLPKYRGASPIQSCLINGETETGITIMHMVKKMDAGDMLAQVKVLITPLMTYGELEQMLCDAAKGVLLDVIRQFEVGTPKAEPQDISQVTFAQKIESEDCQLDWNRPAQVIHNLIRGVNPHPGAWCYVIIKETKKRLKINRSCARASSLKTYKPGVLVAGDKDELLVATGDGILQILELQLEGKKVMSAAEFLRGLGSATIVFV